MRNYQAIVQGILYRNWLPDVLLQELNEISFATNHNQSQEWGTARPLSYPHRI